jgi:hypothetical protein
MINDRLRVAVDQDYVSAIGLATYCFALLEWNAVWCCEKIAPGSIQSLSDRTAGRIATALVNQAAAMPASPDQSALHVAAKDFKSLVEVRNGIMHGKPGTAADGEQRLFRNGTSWTVNSLRDAADKFTECSSRLNDMLYGFLA